MPVPPPPATPEYLIRQPNSPASIHARFWSKVSVRGADECWTWGHAKNFGYGRFGAGAVLGGPASWFAHRVAWTITNGPIPEGAELDHVCHTSDLDCIQGPECPHRSCVNPAHLEIVTHLVNALRREIRRRAFRCGHPFEGNRVGNGGGGRCGECHREKERRARAEGRRAA